MTRHPGLAGLLSLLAIIGAVATRAAGQESKKLDGYTAVVVGEFTVDKGPATQDLPEGIAPLIRTRTIEKLRAEKIFPQVYEGEPVPAASVTGAASTGTSAKQASPATGPAEPSSTTARRLLLTGIVLSFDKEKGAARFWLGLEAKQGKVNVRVVLRDEQTGLQLLSRDCPGTIKGGWTGPKGITSSEGALDAAAEIADGLIAEIHKNRTEGGAAMASAPEALRPETTHQVYVISEKPPAVTILNSETWNMVATVALSSQEPLPKAALISPNGKYLYLFRGYAPRQEHTPAPGWLEVVDLESRGVGEMIPLGWGLAEIVQSKDGRRIFCFSKGEGHAHELRQPALFTVIDADTNQVVSTTTVRHFGAGAIPSDDGSRVLVMAYRQAPQKWYENSMVALVFRPGDATPLSETNSGPASTAAVSPGGKWFYVLDPGVTAENVKNQGWDEIKVTFGARSIRVLNAESGKQAWTMGAGFDPEPGAISSDGLMDTVSLFSQHSALDATGRFFRFTGEDSPVSMDVGEWPLYTVRFEGQPGVFIVSREDLSFLPDASKKTEYQIVLNPKLNGKREPGRKYVNGWPAVAPSLAQGLLGAVPHPALHLPQENPVILYLPQQNKMAILLENQKIAILDLTSRQVQSLTPIGRSGVKVANALARMGVGGAEAGLAGAGFAALDSSSPIPLRQTGLSASPDGKFVYARNFQTHDITILKTEDGSIVHMIGLEADSGPDYLCSNGISSSDSFAKGSCAGTTGMAPGGQQWYSLSLASMMKLNLPSEIAFINTRTNEKTKHDIPGGANLLLMGPERRVLVLGNSKLLVFNAETGEQFAEVKGLTDAKLLVASPPPASENEKPAQPAGSNSSSTAQPSR